MTRYIILTVLLTLCGHASIKVSIDPPQGFEKVSPNSPSTIHSFAHKNKRGFRTTLNIGFENGAGKLSNYLQVCDSRFKKNRQATLGPNNPITVGNLKGIERKIKLKSLYGPIIIQQAILPTDSGFLIANLCCLSSETQSQLPKFYQMLEKLSYEEKMYPTPTESFVPERSFDPSVLHPIQ